MVDFKEIFNKIGFPSRERLQKSFFCFLFDLKKDVRKLKMNIDTKCLVLSHRPSAEIKGLGGLIAQYPKNFEVLCFTTGSTVVQGADAIDSAALTKQRFVEVMKNARVKGYKIFDITDGAIAANYPIFKKIDISEADYIFIPNVYDTNPDTIALLRHFKSLLKEKDYKKNLKIFMFESDFALSMVNYYNDIDSIIETKRKMIETFFPNSSAKILGLNAFRSQISKGSYAEAFLSLTVEEFLAIPVI